MYVDCLECGFESPSFLILGMEESKVKEMVEGMGMKMEIDEKGYRVFFCPKGHRADYLPMIARWWKQAGWMRQSI
jgi:predicted RNA-binding Zn-ribbon protein involved in translation (DUF1610 family)